MSFEVVPSFHNTTVLYQFDGSGDMHGGVQQYINDLGRFGLGYGIEPRLFLGSGRSSHEVIQDVFDNFYASDVDIVGRAHDIIANGSQNQLTSRPVKNVRHLLNTNEPDLVHSQHPNQPQHGGTLDKLFVARNIPRIGTYHIDSIELVTNLAVRASGYLGRRTLSQLDAMIAVSPVAADHMQRTGYYRGEYEIIPNAVDVEGLQWTKRFTPEEIKETGANDADQYIVFVGRPDERKGLGELLEGYKELLPQLPDMHKVELVVCGDGPNIEHYKEKARELGIDKQVTFMGRVDHEDKARWLATADLAVFPAKSGESQGIILLEAMAAGAGAVIAGNNDGYAFTMEKMPSRDLVLFDANFGSAENVETTKLNAFVEKMYVLLTNEVVRHDTHVEQQRLVRDEFDINVVGKRVMSLYHRVLSS